jgi:chemotaxis protein MotB
MARKKKHEEHVNAEAWAIPYGDLVTLLLALFVVMYAMSSVNEGKYRILSDSMIAAFRGTPKSVTPINIGDHKAKAPIDKKLAGEKPTTLMKIQINTVPHLMALRTGEPPDPLKTPSVEKPQGAGTGGEGTATLIRMEREVQQAMQALIDAHLVTVRHENLWLEVEINTDILFPSGAAAFTAKAEPVLDKLAGVLRPFPNPIRVEGHTDDRPIKTAAFPSNWELSAARAASVVHQFTRAGIDPLRLEIVGFGEFHPRKPNTDDAGRNANRRVAILIMEATATPDTMVARATQAAQQVAAARNAGLADAGGSVNSLVATVPPAALEKTVLSKETQGIHAGGDAKSH